MIENILTYVETYRDTDFSQMPFQVIDGLILSQVSYYNYRKSPFVRTDFSIPLALFYQNCNPEKILNHTITTDGDRVLIEALKPGGRHGNLRASNYVDVIDDAHGIQFSAITFELGNEEYYIAFRGTDNTVTGWKEDLNLSYLDVVPAQKAALQYAMHICGEFAGNFYIGGHSKGGNLAVYAAMNLPEPYKNRILEVHDFDGPGFMKEVYQAREYQEIRPLIRKYVPQSSIVGMMWERDDNYVVVHSDEKGLMQHDPFSWTIRGTAFVFEEEVDASSRYMKRTLERWVEELSSEEREQFIELIFDVIFDSGINQFYELTEELLQKIQLMAEGIKDMTEEERKLVRSAVKQLLLISVKEIPQRIKEEWEEEKDVWNAR